MTTPQQPNEAARLTQVLLDAGYSKRQVGQIIGRNPSLVSQFFTKGKGASFVPALERAVEAMQHGAATSVEELRDVAAPLIQRRRTARGHRARVRDKDMVTGGRTATSASARAARQHIASGASRLRPVIQHAAGLGPDGRVAFTVRAKKSDFVHDSGRLADSPGIRRNVVQRRDGTEERSYGNSMGPGTGEYGFDAGEWQDLVDAAGGDVAQAVLDWLVRTGRVRPGTKLTHLEVRSFQLPRGWRRGRHPGDTQPR